MGSQGRRLARQGGNFNLKRKSWKKTRKKTLKKLGHNLKRLKMPEVLQTAGQAKVESSPSQVKDDRWSGFRKAQAVVKPESKSEKVVQLSVGVIDEEKQTLARNTEKVKLCCLTITTGPGTAFTTFQIPGGAKCAACGSLLNKSE